MKESINITIRTATDKDSKDILDLIFNIWINEYNFDVKKEDFPDLREIEASYNDPGGLFLVALNVDQIIGAIACQKLNNTCFILKRMFVDKAFRGHGIAQLLLDRLWDKVVFSNGVQSTSFYLSTKENEAIAAKRFYLKNNFHVISREDVPDDFPFFYEDDLFMRWEYEALLPGQH